MSKFCGELNSEGTLKAAEQWRKNGLLSDGSIFTSKSLWKLKHLRALDEFFIQRIDKGEGTFFEKLSEQLAPTEPEVKQLAAEIFWVLSLCPCNVSEATKREGVLTIWEWSEEPLEANSPWLQDEVLPGVGSGGVGYNTNRWRELVFIIQTMIAFKQLSQAERVKLLSDGWELAKWLERIPDCEVRQFRHMMLYLLFPDDFERIFSKSDRMTITSVFTGKSKTKVRSLTTFEIDKELAAIRKKSEQDYNTTEIDFYVPPLRDLWSRSRNKSWLLSWNPQKWKWETFADDRATTREGKIVTIQWRCANHSAKVGDKAYLVRTGVDPKGIIAVGNIVKASYEDAHRDDEKTEAGQATWYVDVAFSRIQDPLTDPYLSFDDLSNIKLDQQVWNPMSSGIEIKQRSAGLLEKFWKFKIAWEIAPEVPETSEPRNLILYGPPGTGKTYQLNNLIELYSSKKTKISREAWLTQKVQDMRWFDVIFATLFDLGAKAKVTEIVNHEFIALKARTKERHQNISSTIWSTLQVHASEYSQTVRYKNRTAPCVFDKTTDGFWILVDDWEEECAEQVGLAEELREGPVVESIQRRFEFVTFHQAYCYEDFVEGIRPVQDEDTGEMAYQIVPGVFQRIAKKAKVDPGQRYAIFIDEINRGNIAKIFGELITLIEPDKRVKYSQAGERLSGMEITLPYSGNLFGVPANLDLYGTMNTADRSIAMLDTALRRRFNFNELMPDTGLINGSRGDGYIEDGEGGEINLRSLLDAMNRRIRFLLNRDMTLGHAYFINIRNFSGLQDVLLNQIIPLLQEYFYEDWHRIQLVFSDVGPAGEKIEPQIICHETLNEQEVLGFDHDDYEDSLEYRVATREELTPDAVRKVYEGVS